MNSQTNLLEYEFQTLEKQSLEFQSLVLSPSIV